MEAAVRRLFPDRYQTGIYYPARQPYAGGCETEVEAAVWRRLSDGCFQIGIRQSILAEGVSRYIRSTQCID